MANEKFDLVLSGLAEMQSAFQTGFEEVKAEVSEVKTKTIELDRKFDLSVHHLDVRMDIGLKQVEEKIDRLDEKVAAEIDRLDRKMGAGFNAVEGRLKVVDLRLHLIEQRLNNIEPWVSAENEHLRYDPNKHTAA